MNCLCTGTVESHFLGMYSPALLHMVSDASLDQTHGMLAGNLELLGIDGLMHNPRIVQEVWLWVETRL